MIHRLIPHPGLSALLVIVWMVMVNDVTFGTLFLGLVTGLLVPLFTAAYWPGRPRVRFVPGIAYLGLVIADIIVANFQVARIVLFMPRDKICSAWVTVPLDLHSPEAITLLAGTITMTPGTLTADMSACGRALLIHSLHAPDPDAVRDDIKARYESRLKRIFE